MFKILSLVACLCIISLSAHAEIYLRKTPNNTSGAVSSQKAPPSGITAHKEKSASQTAIDNARAIANACVSGKWEEQPCLKAVSQNNLVMASNYGALLEEKGKKDKSELIKQHCAASTAATRDTFPAYAMRSAYVECVNIIVDVAQASGELPDQSQYQLLVSAVQCLDKQAACASVETSLSRYKN